MHPVFTTRSGTAVPIWFVTDTTWPALRHAFDAPARSFADASGFEPKLAQCLLLPGGGGLSGVLFGLNVNSFLVDAIIGLSVVYKAFDNLGGFQTLFGFQPNTKLAVLGFGLAHGFGLATKLQALKLSPNGLLTNMVSFNVGVELGQLLALTIILALIIALISRAATSRARRRARAERAGETTRRRRRSCCADETPPCR